MAKYSVLLIYPDPTDLETFYAFVEASNPTEAANAARVQVCREHGGEFQLDEFACLGVWSGHLELEGGIYSGI